MNVLYYGGIFTGLVVLETYLVHMTAFLRTFSVLYFSYRNFCATILLMLGGLVGKLITFDTTGIDFALTALFTVILLDQMKEADNKLPALVSVVSASGCLLLLGPKNFLLPSLLVTVAVLLLLRPRLEKPPSGENEGE